MTKEVKPDEVDDDTSLEDMEISFKDVSDDEAETFEEEESEEATKEESDEDDAETETEEVESEESKEESEESKDESEESEEADETQLSDEEKQKQHNREMAEKRIQEKRQREAEIKRQQDQYVSESEDETQLAVRQLQIEAYNTKVTTNESKLKTSYEKAMVDFPVLADRSVEIQAELDQALDTFQGLYVTIDAWGNPAEVRGDLYSFLQAKAESIQRLTKIGAKKESNAKSKGKANALTPPSRMPKSPKADEAMDAFDEEASRW